MDGAAEVGMGRAEEVFIATAVSWGFVTKFFCQSFHRARSSLMSGFISDRNLRDS